MKKEQLYESMRGIGDELLARSEEAGKSELAGSCGKKADRGVFTGFCKYVAVAACLCLIAGVAAVAALLFIEQDSGEWEIVSIGPQEIDQGGPEQSTSEPCSQEQSTPGSPAQEQSTSEPSSQELSLPLDPTQEQTTSKPPEKESSDSGELMVDSALKDGRSREEYKSLSEARENAEYGAYLPSQAPSGYVQYSITHTWGEGDDSLSGLWTKGMRELRWSISSLTEAAQKRITSIEDTVNYDMGLYSIPLAESVPKELWGIVNDPIFRAEEITLDAVWKRAYQVQDTGDVSGYRMQFSVLYGDVVVEINSKGVDPEWVYEELAQIQF